MHAHMLVVGASACASAGIPQHAHACEARVFLKMSQNFCCILALGTQPDEQQVADGAKAEMNSVGLGQKLPDS